MKSTSSLQSNETKQDSSVVLRDGDRERQEGDSEDKEVHDLPPLKCQKCGGITTPGGKNWEKIILNMRWCECEFRPDTHPKHSEMLEKARYKRALSKAMAN